MVRFPGELGVLQSHFCSIFWVVEACSRVVVRSGSGPVRAGSAPRPGAPGSALKKSQAAIAFGLAPQEEPRIRTLTALDWAGHPERHEGSRVSHNLRQDSPWSSGMVEGSVNKIKMVKRQMYGRAGLPLLRKRVLLL